MALAAIADAVTGTTLHHALLHHAETDPSRPFLADIAGLSAPVAYGDLEAMVSGTAGALRQLGVRSGDRVAVLMARSAEYVAAALAVQRAGAIYVPCSPLFADETLRHVLHQTEAAWLIADEASAAQLPRAGIGTSGPLRVIGPGWLGRPAATLEQVFTATGKAMPPPADPGAVAMVSYTSGTTALPKGVIFTHGNWLHCAVNITSGLQWTAGERVLQQLPLHPANGGLVVLAPSILHGSAIVLAPSFDPAEFAPLLAAGQISLAFLSGREIAALLSQPASAAEREHSCHRMAERLGLSAEDKRQFEQRYGVTLISQYGCSETLGPVVFSSPGLPVTEGSIGRAIPGYQIGVADPTEPSGPGEADGAIGEFVVRSLSPHGISPGYWPRTEAGVGPWRDGWLHTGDTVWLDGQGCVHYLGRLADASGQITRVLATRRVEQAIRGCAGVREAVALLDPDGRDLIVFVVADEACNPRYLREQGLAVGTGETIQILRVSSIPRDILGKVSRRELRSLLAAARSDGTAGEMVMTQEEDQRG